MGEIIFATSKKLILEIKKGTKRIFQNINGGNNFVNGLLISNHSVIKFEKKGCKVFPAMDILALRKRALSDYNMYTPVPNIFSVVSKRFLIYCNKISRNKKYT